MSYIRSGSNPEGLYIWGDGKNVTIIKGKKTLGTIPTKILDGLILKCYNGKYDEICAYKGASISDIWDNGELKTKLSYGEWNIIMWDVTWTFIVYTNLKSIRSKNRNKNE